MDGIIDQYEIDLNTTEPIKKILYYPNGDKYIIEKLDNGWISTSAIKVIEVYK